MTAPGTTTATPKPTAAERTAAHLRSLLALVAPDVLAAYDETGGAFVPRVEPWNARAPLAWPDRWESMGTQERAALVHAAKERLVTYALRAGATITRFTDPLLDEDSLPARIEVHAHGWRLP